MDDNKKPIAEIDNTDYTNGKEIKKYMWEEGEGWVKTKVDPLDPQYITRKFRRFKKRDPKFCRRYNLKYPIGKKATVDDCKGLLVQIEKRLNEKRRSIQSKLKMIDKLQKINTNLDIKFLSTLFHFLEKADYDLKEDKDNECTFKAFAIKLSQFDDDLDAKKVRAQKALEQTLSQTKNSLIELEKTIKREPISENSLEVHRERLRQAVFLDKHIQDFFKEFKGGLINDTLENGK